MVELSIIIVGAGITGLASAIALSRAGHRVQILEKSSFKREAGFMLSVMAPASLVLESFEFDFRKARSTDIDFLRVHNGQNLDQLAGWKLRGYTNRPDDQARSFYRPDLHDELKRIALLQSEDWITPTLRLGAEVKSVDIQNAKVYFKDGSSVTGDVVIGADGERSQVRSAFTSADPLTQYKDSLLRAIIPTERLLERPETHDLYLSTKKKLCVYATPDHRAITWFEGRDGLLLACECRYRLPEGDHPPAEKDSAKSKEMVLEKFRDFHPGLVETLRQAERVSDWELWHGNGVWHMHESKTLLVGDAAHSMLPFTGQGGGQGIEDAGALGVLFRDVGSKDEVVDRMKLFEELRQERTAIIQSLAGTKIGNEAQLAKDNPDHLINKTSVRSPEEHLDYMCCYNVIAEAERLLNESLKARV